VQTLGTALSGRSRERPELAATPIPLELRIATLPCRGGEAFLRQLFAPLGYEVEAEQHPLDRENPEWGASRYFTVTLRGTHRLADALSHLYVLVPVLDDEKHYWVEDDEVAKLLRHGRDWLASHPAREAITTRYLKHQRSLARSAISQLTTVEELDPDAEEESRDAEEESRDAEEAAVERPLRLNEQRLNAAVAALRASGARRVLDLGCGEGALLRLLLADPAARAPRGSVRVLPASGGAAGDVRGKAHGFTRDRHRLPRRGGGA
jgi:3' terminal RNA ribose 2'-O-methyltransferase Hen1